MELGEIGERYGRYRQACPESEREMGRSLREDGQMSPIVVCLREEKPELIDGFKRLAGARLTGGLKRLQARVIEADERGVKVAMYRLNCVGGRPRELEEARIVFGLVREDGLSQIEVAELLGRHKSWVCRRLALLEKLCEEAQEDLRVGLMSVGQARELVRLPAGNQREVVEVVRREGLSRDELARVVNLLEGCTGNAQERFVLSHPREALAQDEGREERPRDPRLSDAGNRMSGRLSMLLDLLGGMENWLHSRGRAGLTEGDRKILDPGFEKLVRDARAVAELTEDFLREKVPA